MICLTLPNLRQTRARAFFWIGLLILPVFWIWWMRARCFSRTERRLGWAWTAIYLALAGVFHEQLSPYASLLPLGYPIVAMWVAKGLVVWLMFRMCTLLNFVFLFFAVGGHLLIAMSQAEVSCIQAGGSPGIWVLPALLAIAHLLVAPDWGGLKSPVSQRTGP